MHVCCSVVVVVVVVVCLFIFPKMTILNYFVLQDGKCTLMKSPAVNQPISTPQTINTKLDTSSKFKCMHFTTHFWYKIIIVVRTAFSIRLRRCITVKIDWACNSIQSFRYRSHILPILRIDFLETTIQYLINIHVLKSRKWGTVVIVCQQMITCTRYTIFAT